MMGERGEKVQLLVVVACGKEGVHIVNSGSGEGREER